MSRDHEQDGDVRELRRLLAVPAERDFPEGRQVQREEHLMRGLRTLAGQRTDGRGRRVGQRLAMGLAAAAVAAGVTVALPGGSDSGTESGKKAENGTEQGTEKDTGTGTGTGKKTDAVPAGYAVKKNANGTLTIYLKELSMWSNGDAAHFKEMTAKIRAAGFTAVVENFPWDKICGQDRGEVLKPEKTGDGDWDYRYVMTHSDTYLLTVHEPEPAPKGSGTTQPTFYSDKFIKGPVKPCKSS
ncbi:hypothetical protein ACFYXF_09085 [Streptomyces sp. NPDC002680]|uniref:hypothetical protein n=1 Tax=Streptomyces sp. NPDC002680 TaxID=3364659 RepID=UPI003674AB35